MSFENINLYPEIRRALKDEGYTVPTPIQTQAIPVILEHKDIIGCAQTGTGKTAAFALPILQMLMPDKPGPKTYRRIRALIISPTRELSLQIAESFAVYGQYTGLRTTVVYGGVSLGKQIEKLKMGTDILVATPGRLLDLLGQNIFSIDSVKMFVLDEADTMLDMGFIHDIKKIIKHLPEKRQSLFFSATMPKQIIALANEILTDPFKINVTPDEPTVEKIDQSVYFVSKQEKKKLLIAILKDKSITSALIFTRTRYGADNVERMLNRLKISTAAIHSDKAQNVRQRSLNGFKNKTIRVLVATDIASRGIDIDELTLVINYEIPNIPETYVHRIGRTGRAGAVGRAISFCDPEERAFLKDIQKLIKREIPVAEKPHLPKEEKREAHSKNEGNSVESVKTTPEEKTAPAKKTDENAKQREHNAKQSVERFKRKNRDRDSERRNDRQAGEKREHHRERKPGQDNNPERSGKPQSERSSEPKRKTEFNPNPEHNRNRERSEKSGDNRKFSRDRKPERGSRPGFNKSADRSDRPQRDDRPWRKDKPERSNNPEGRFKPERSHTAEQGKKPEFNRKPERDRTTESRPREGNFRKSGNSERPFRDRKPGSNTGAPGGRRKEGGPAGENRNRGDKKPFGRPGQKSRNRNNNNRTGASNNRRDDNK